MKQILPVFLLLAAFQLNAQVTLNTSPYNENFDNIGGGLPTGFSIYTAATASTIGTSAVLTTTKALWTSTTGSFKNYASATGLTSAATNTDQDNSTNRALAVRQTGSFGDPGAAFVFQVANTTGKSNFQLSFLLQSLDISSTRTTTWVVDYGVGASPSVFTVITATPVSLTTGNTTFSSTAVTVNFGTALDNIADVVTIRVWASTASTGTNTRATTGIDEWVLSWTGTSAINDLFSRDSYVKLVGNTPDKLSLQFNKSINNKIQLQLTSINGQVVYTRAIAKVTEGQTESVPMASLPKGIYFVSILSKDGNYGTKISH